jgi:proteasome lid subunit RPN8/RPN11
MPGHVRDAVRAHAVEVHERRPGHESVGAFVLSGENVLRYVRMHNTDPRPNRVNLWSASQLRRPGGLPLVLCHSHPRSKPTPSDLDLGWAARLGLDLIAIFSVVTDELKLWRLDGTGTFAEVEFAVA